MTNCLLTIQSGIEQGDQKALAQLYQQYQKKLIEFANTIVRSKEVSEEIVEDVFVRLWANRHAIAAIQNLTVYLYVAVKNRSLNALSKKARDLITASFDFLEIEVNDQGPDPHQLMITSEMMQRMQTAIRNLPPRCKMIFKLIREDGLKYKEVAEVLNISVNTIDAQMAIAVKRICEALDLYKAPKNALKTVQRSSL